ncbi:hypothetical protein K1719_042205 [Acacia pycnantha]|nr:hypothetical protein K1719_042205 [Acacia pycnantha]
MRQRILLTKYSPESPEMMKETSAMIVASITGFTKTEEGIIALPDKVGGKQSSIWEYNGYVFGGCACNGELKCWRGGHMKSKPFRFHYMGKMRLLQHLSLKGRLYIVVVNW